MKKRFLLLCSIFSAFLPTISFAGSGDTTIPGQFTGSVALTSDYIFRGVSQTNEDPAVQGSINYNYDAGDGFGLYTGIWASNVDFADANTEFDFSAGVTYKLKDWNFDVGSLYYAYPGADSNLNYDYWEAKFGAGYDFKIAAVNGAVYYTPEEFGDNGNGYYYVLGAAVPLPCDFTLDGHVGHSEFDDKNPMDSYTDWAFGIAYNFKGVTLKLEYTDTDLKQSELDDSREVFTISKAF